MFSKAFGEANNEVAREVYRGAGVCRSLWREPRVSCDLREGGLRDSGCVIGREAEVGLIEAAANIERVIREAIEAETYRQQSGRSERNRVLDAGGIHFAVEQIRTRTTVSIAKRIATRRLAAVVKVVEVSQPAC